LALLAALVAHKPKVVLVRQAYFQPLPQTVVEAAAVRVQHVLVYLVALVAVQVGNQVLLHQVLQELHLQYKVITVALIVLHQIIILVVVEALEALEELLLAVPQHQFL
jgi:hypothetical protein